MKSTLVFLITGFLGSGKTTFLANVIRYYNGKKKIGIVQNEFAPANLDGKELKHIVNEQFDLLEINNGSVFCLCLLADFVNSLEQFITQYQPDVLFIEASGLADPIAIAEILTSEKLRDKLLFSGSVCIVDALNFEKINKTLKRVEHQIIIADKIIVNKTDLVNDSEELSQTIKDLNPYAEIYNSSYCKVPVGELLLPVSETAGMRLFKAKSIPPAAGRPDIHPAVLRTTRAINKDGLESFLEAVSKLAIRVKGYILTKDHEVIAVQSSFGICESKRIDVSYTQTELIAMGYDINVRLLSDLYKKYT